MHTRPIQERERPHSGHIQDERPHSRRETPEREIYCYDAPDTFGKQRVALTGKVGGMKDDLVIALQLGIFFTDWDAKYGLHVYGEGGDPQSYQG